MNLKGSRRFRVYEQVLSCYAASINKETSIFQSYQYKKNGLPIIILQNLLRNQVGGVQASWRQIRQIHAFQLPSLHKEISL